MSEYRQSTEARVCPRFPTQHVYARVTTEVIAGVTIISKECATCGQFISKTTLPVERRTAQ